VQTALARQQVQIVEGNECHCQWRCYKPGRAWVWGFGSVTKPPAGFCCDMLCDIKVQGSVRPGAVCARAPMLGVINRCDVWIKRCYVWPRVRRGCVMTLSWMRGVLLRSKLHSIKQQWPELTQQQQAPMLRLPAITRNILLGMRVAVQGAAMYCYIVIY
jgi:hypothetical protein